MKKIEFVVCFLLLAVSTYAYNLRQITSKEGLSNSAILSICQDSHGFMWFGSVDGLNMYNGTHIRVFKPAPNNPNSLSSNLIENILETDNEIIWVMTNHGFNKIDKKRYTIENHNEYEGRYFAAKSVNNELFVIYEDNRIDYYHKAENCFKYIDFEDIQSNRVLNFFIDSEDVFWIFLENGEIKNASLTFDNQGDPIIQPIEKFAHPVSLLFIFKEDDKIYFIDNQYAMFELDIRLKKKSFIIDLEKEILKNGMISTIIRDNDDYLVAFQTNGLIRLKNTPESEIKFKVERVEIFCGVFSLWKDKSQNIIWIGTDGQGVFMYSRDSFSIRSTTFQALSLQMQKPIRALLTDEQNNLWIGTKDDGIFVIKDYEKNRYEKHNEELIHYTISNSELLNNSIYALSKSRRNLIWIGGDGPGLNYFSYRDKKIKEVPSKTDEPILYIHSIIEINDSVLWMASVGTGILKVTLSGDRDNPVIESIERTTFIKDEFSYNYFFSAYRENDSILWFGNRGYGAKRVNINNSTFQTITFHKENIETINDILSIHKDRNGTMWFGSSFGLIKLLGFDGKSAVYENYSEIEGLPNNTIHGILEDDRGYLWLSTNNGIVQFDTQHNHFRILNSNNGLDVTEFSDGAYFKDSQTGDLLFGGTNGFVSIEQDIFEEPDFVPPIVLTELKIYDKEQNINKFMKHHKKRGNYLELKYEQNFFSVSFIALDYIHGQNNRYSYNLENLNDKWIDNHNTNEIKFTDLSPGKYILHVCNKSSTPGLPESTYNLPIVILPPWYLSIWALLAYAGVITLSVFAAIEYVRRRYRRKRELMIDRLNREHKEKVYESKLRFFTNITHEFSTPLTLIYGPCARIMSYHGSDSYVKKYTSLIQKNAERLNTLIQELIEFRKIETGNRICEIENLAVTDLAENIVDSFTDLAETRSIAYRIEIEKNLFWNSDKSGLTKIITNLLSNAFKYTPDGGEIEYRMEKIGNTLQIKVSNSGKGIREEDIPYVFDRYRVLENLELQTRKGAYSRNGLGLAICHNMVKLLQGEIEVMSDPNVKTVFMVTLPTLETNNSEDTKTNVNDLYIPKIEIEENEIKTENYKFIKSRQTILVVDDDHEMLWFIAEIFRDHYNIIPVEYSPDVISILDEMHPDLILSDIMMPDWDGISLLKQIKNNKHTSHIPFILISAKNSSEEQIEGIAAGAEAYITKPFNVDYLKSLVNRLLQRQDDLKDYFRSAQSTFKLEDGKYIHQSDKEFFNKVIDIIDKNITDLDFSTEKLASILGLSTRHLYRKLKNCTAQTPSELIKDYRLTVVEKLLIETQLSVDEIVYKVGFNNRNSLYRLFSQKYGMTPKSYREQKKKDL